MGGLTPSLKFFFIFLKKTLDKLRSGCYTIIRKRKEVLQMKIIDKLFDKVMNSEAKILNPSEKTITVMARIGLALIPTSWIIVVVALLTM